MKIRNGFVSNSSSSSFIVEKNDLTAEQIHKILNHETYGGEWARTDPWEIRQTETQIGGSTWMNNFDMRYFMHEIGVPENKITWDELPFNLMEDLFPMEETFDDQSPIDWKEEGF